jgi:plasmid replication initiation protein
MTTPEPQKELFPSGEGTSKPTRKAIVPERIQRLAEAAKQKAQEGKVQEIDPNNRADLDDENALIRIGGQLRRSNLRDLEHPNGDLFVADLLDYALKDDGASMEAPIFSLATKPDLRVWKWVSKDGSKSLEITPSVKGRATQHDKDILIFLVSQMTEGLNLDRPDAKSRTIRFCVYDYLVKTNKSTGGKEYQRLEESLERLSGTRIKTDIKTGGERIKESFGIIDSWKIVEKTPQKEVMVAVEVTLSKWLYNAIQAFEVLTIDSAYFQLRKPIEKRLYEIARKHVGKKTGWKIGLELLKEKCGSQSELREFRRMIKDIAKDNTLPNFFFTIDARDNVTFMPKDKNKLLGLLS